MPDPQYQYLTDKGVILPDVSETLTEVQDEWKDTFGSDLETDPSTPQGVLITSETLARNNVLNNNASLANQINPNISGGIFLDALLALTGVQRNIQQPTIVQNVTLTGEPNTQIEVGSQAKTSVGDLFELVSTVTIPVGGTILATFQSVDYGPIPCPNNALNIIVTDVLGWETITNDQGGSPPSTTTLGATTQGDPPARAFRLNTLGFQGLSLAAAITSALYYVPGVRSLTFQENISASVQTINGISMVPHSVYACVDGGVDTAVAAALLENKSSGAAWNGGTTVNVVEPAAGQTYAVQFDRPALVPIFIKATVSGITPDQAVQAILDYAAGNIPNLKGFVVGADVSAFEIAAAIVAENPSASVSSCTISLSTSFSTTPIPIGVNQKATTELSAIVITVG